MSGFSARAEILARIRSANEGVAASPSPPEPVHARPGDPRLFETRVDEYRAKVTKLDDERDTGAAVADILARHGAGAVVIPAGLPDSWRPPGIEVIVDDGRLTVDEVDRVDAAVTGSLLAIAATGTIVLDAGPRCGRRLLSLLPDLHVCVVREAVVVADVIDALASIDGDQQAALTFVSGPSATSDIEFERVEGVHGPRRLEVLLLGPGAAEEQGAGKAVPTR